MKQTVRLLITVFFVAVGLAGSAAAQGQPLFANMSGANEVPGPGDPDGSGAAVITFNQGRGEICWAIAVTGIALPATGAHIHIGDVTSSGGVVVALSPPDETGFSSGCADVDPEMVKEIRKDPDGYYVNVHSTEFPAGAVRGQLTRPGNRPSDDN